MNYFFVKLWNSCQKIVNVSLSLWQCHRFLYKHITSITTFSLERPPPAVPAYRLYRVLCFAEPYFVSTEYKHAMHRQTLIPYFWWIRFSFFIFVNSCDFFLNRQSHAPFAPPKPPTPHPNLGLRRGAPKVGKSWCNTVYDQVVFFWDHRNFSHNWTHDLIAVWQQYKLLLYVQLIKLIKT